MKKIIAVILVLALSIACVSCAFAEQGKKYNSSTLKRQGKTSSAMTSGTNARIRSAALILMETILKAGNGMQIYESVSTRGNCYIACYGKNVDVYYPVRGGKYLNLFASPNTGVIKDYGFGSYTGSYDYTYYKISMSKVWIEVANLVTNYYK